MNMEYRLVTLWCIEAPIEAVCGAISHSLNWPQWWRNVECVEELAPGDARGIGSVRRYTWRGRLPYRLTFDIRVVHAEQLTVVEGIASGDVEGQGRWAFTTDGRVTRVRLDWQVRTTSAWMNLLAPFARPLFRWNHDGIMRCGGEALARMLNARLTTRVVSFESFSESDGQQKFIGNGERGRLL
jgi:hypothetical protein